MTMNMVIVGLCMVAAEGFGQVTPPLSDNQPTTAPGSRDVLRLLLPAAQGLSDPFAAIPNVLDCGDSATKSLHDIALLDTCFASGEFVSSSKEEKRHARLFAIVCLGSLASSDGYRALLGIASNTQDPDVKCEALTALGIAYHRNSFLDLNKPDTNLIHLLLMNLDDTSYLVRVQKSIGQVAREGLMEWTGRDFGEPQGRTLQVSVSDPKVRTPLYLARQLWWDEMARKVSWDANNRQFVLP
jgi:hypothetical protein